MISTTLFDMSILRKRKLDLTMEKCRFTFCGISQEVKNDQNINEPILERGIIPLYDSSDLFLILCNSVGRNYRNSKILVL